MNEVYNFLKEAQIYYIATLKDGKPAIRPFGTINLYNNNLYIQTGRKKECFKQMNNNNVSICAFKNGEWIRLETFLVADDNLDAEIDMLNHYENLKSMYKAGDGNNVVLKMTNSKAEIFSFEKEKRTIIF